MSLNTITTSNFSYSQNSYVDSNGADLTMYSVGKIGVIRCNLSVSSLPTGQTDKVIGSYPGKTFKTNHYVNIPSQTGKGTMLLIVAADGKVSASNVSGSAASGFYRASIPIVLA